MSGIAPIVYLNGSYVAREQACLPITDRALLFGDSVYEVVMAYGGKLFRPIQHIGRLGRSLSGIGMREPLPTEAWLKVLTTLAEQLPGQDQIIYLQVTRGDYAGRSHAIPDEVRPNVFAFTSRLPPPDRRMAAEGIRAVTLDDIRWQRCNIKATTLLANVLAHSQARSENADEAIFVRDGKAIEGTASNLFIVAAGVIVTPPNSQWLLPGITRDLVLEMARDAGLPHAEESIDVAALDKADEIWLTSSTKEVMPVTRLNGRPVANGKPGAVWRRINELFAQRKAELRLTGNQAP